MLRSALVSIVVAGLALSVCPGAAAQAQLTITSAPVITGEPRVGAELTATPGEWTGGVGEVRAEYRWYRCPPVFPPSIVCDEVTESRVDPGRYTIGEDDLGYALAIQLTVTQGIDTASAFSAPTDRVIPRAPSNTARPEIEGTAREGRVLTASPGEWQSASPLTFTYRWDRCDRTGTGCHEIATGRTYAVVATDVGSRLRVAVMAQNEGGASAPARSGLTGVVTPSRLINVKRPAITGTAAVGRALRATTGRWNDPGAIDFDYRWLRCEDDGRGCVPVGAATDATYRVRARDTGFRLRVRVTATGDSGTAASESALTAVVPDARLARPVPMRPFPRVRIRGLYTSRGAALNLVLVRGARGAMIGITCQRARCPFRHRERRVNSWRFRLRALERAFPAGTRIVLRITRPLRIGKYTKIVIRAGRPPTRRDRCLMPDSPRPVDCGS